MSTDLPTTEIAPRERIRVLPPLSIAATPPTLLITVDTEEEFDWDRPAAAQKPVVTHIPELTRLQDVCDDCGARPTYVLDYPVLRDARSVEALRGLLARGTCELGTHMHPWVTPPIQEAPDPRNTYLCNLPRSLQEEKLGRLGDAFREAFGMAPTSFKAGRYGFTHEMTDLLVREGYQVDGSVVAYTDFSGDGGPDFRAYSERPYRLHDPVTDATLLEVPCSVAYTRGRFASAHAWHQRLSHGLPSRLRAIGVLWHSRLLRKVFVSPELHQLADLKAALVALVREGSPVLHVTLHSPSVAPGHTPYVRTLQQRDELLATLRELILFARTQLGAQCKTLTEFATSFAGTQP